MDGWEEMIDDDCCFFVCYEIRNPPFIISNLYKSKSNHTNREEK